MPRYRKLPVEIEAFHATEFSLFPHPKHMPQWMLDAWKDGSIKVCGDVGSGVWFLEISTLEGVMRASPGDFIICGVSGELYPCKPDIFAITYEPVQ